MNKFFIERRKVRDIFIVQMFERHKISTKKHVNVNSFSIFHIRKNNKSVAIDKFNSFKINTLLSNVHIATINTVFLTSLNAANTIYLCQNPSPSVVHPLDKMKGIDWICHIFFHQAVLVFNYCIVIKSWKEELTNNTNKCPKMVGFLSNSVRTKWRESIANENNSKANTKTLCYIWFRP